MRSIISRIVRKFCSFFPRPVKYLPVYVPVLESELLKDRVALVTGGTGGIGFAIAEAYLKAGARVIIAGRNEQRLAEAVEKLKQIGEVLSIVLDVLKPESFQTALDTIGRFDILVNNAGYVGGGWFGCTEVVEYEKTLDTNLKGTYFLSQAVSKQWIQNGIKGNILNVCSASSLRPGNSPYILSKWGLRTLTVGMARDLICHGIVVNGIAPGCTNTPQFCDENRCDITNKRNPTHRLVTMQEVANLSVVMVSALAKMVVGDILYVTGGGAITTFDDGWAAD